VDDFFSFSLESATVVRIKRASSQMSQNHTRGSTKVKQLPAKLSQLAMMAKKKKKANT
jgi:hypothetical protein